MKKSLLLLLFFIVCFGHCGTGQTGSAGDRIRQMLGNWKYDEAIRAADEILSIDSSDTEILLLKGRALASTFRYREAEGILRKAESVDSSNLDIIMALINACRLAGEEEQALRGAARAVQLEPENRFFRIQQAALFYQYERYPEALGVLVPLYLNDTGSVYFMKELASCYSSLKKPDSELYYYRKVFAFDSTDVTVIARIVNILIQKRKLEAALQFTDSFIRHDTSVATVLRLDGYIRYLMKDYTGAEVKFLSCIRLGDTSRFVLKNLGLSFYRQEIYNSAGPLFLRAYHADTTDAESCFYFAVCADRTGQTDTGMVYYQKTLRLIMPSPRFLSTVYSEMAGLYNQLGLPDTALVLLQRALDSYPEGSLLIFKMAYQYDYFLRRPQDALPWYREFLLRNSDQQARLFNQPFQISYTDFATRRIEEISRKNAVNNEQ